ncbi:MAG: VOC family protein [Bythopirellula sp.]
MPAANLEPGHFNHIALPTADAERGAQFYCEVLGFRLVPRPAFSFDGRWLYRQEAGVMIHLIHDENHQPGGEPLNTRGHHFALQSSDVTRDLQLLAEHNVETVERILPDYQESPTGYRQVFFHDPDGNVVEIGEWPAVADMVVPD